MSARRAGPLDVVGRVVCAHEGVFKGGFGAWGCFGRCCIGIDGLGLVGFAAPEQGHCVGSGSGLDTRVRGGQELDGKAGAGALLEFVGVGADPDGQFELVVSGCESGPGG